MNVRDKAVIQKNLGYLVKHLDLNSVRVHLYQNFILTDNDMEILSKSSTTQSEKIEILMLIFLPRRGPEAYSEFIQALEQDGHQLHVIERLNNTILSDEDLAKAERSMPRSSVDSLDDTSEFEVINIENNLSKTFRKAQEVSAEDLQKIRLGSEDLHNDEDLNNLFMDGRKDNYRPKDLNEFYTKLSLREDLESEVFSCPGNSFENKGRTRSTGSDCDKDNEKHDFKNFRDLDLFPVELKKNDSSEECGFEPGLYMLHVTMEGVLLLSREEYLKVDDIEECPRKAVWSYHVIRFYAGNHNTFFLEVGGEARTGEGSFSFKTRETEEGPQIAQAIRNYIGKFHSNNNPLYRTIRRGSCPNTDLN